MNAQFFKKASVLISSVWLISFSSSVWAESVEIPVHGAGDPLAREMELKNAEIDRFVGECEDLLSFMSNFGLEVVDEDAITEGKSSYGRLSKLQEKARYANELARELEKSRHVMTRLLNQLESARTENESLQKERDEAVATLEKVESSIDTLKTRVVGLRETVGRLLLGEFEYYEVKAGDSLQSIAANPLVYGDSSRALWLRQVNEGRVKHIDNLREGEMLVIPRFPRNGSYEF